MAEDRLIIGIEIVPHCDIQQAGDIGVCGDSGGRVLDCRSGNKNTGGGVGRYALVGEVKGLPVPSVGDVGVGCGLNLGNNSLQDVGLNRVVHRLAHGFHARGDEADNGHDSENKDAHRDDDLDETESARRNDAASRGR